MLIILPIWDSKNVISYDLYIHYTIYLKLGEIIVDIHTYKLCNIEIYVLLNLWFLLGLSDSEIFTIQMISRHCSQ